MMIFVVSSSNAAEPYLMKYETMIGILTVLDAVNATSGLTGMISR